MKNEKKPKKRSLWLLSVFTVVLLLAFMAVPAFAFEGDLVIEAGTYRFNDTLSLPTIPYDVDVPIVFVGTTTERYGTFDFTSESIRFVGSENLWFMQYYITSVVPDAEWFMPIPEYKDAAENGDFLYFWGDGIKTITVLEDTSVSSDFYMWFIQNAVPVNSFRDSVTSGLTVVIDWVGTVVSSLFSGELSGLLPIVAIPVAVTLLVLAIYFIRRSIWGA